VVLGRSR
jgi:hypothetical protein